MSERIYTSDRDPNAWTVRSALSNLSAENMENLSERELLIKYQDTLRQLNQKEKELHDTRELWSNIHTDKAVKKSLQESAARLASQINILDQKLRELQVTPILLNVIKREEAKYCEELKRTAEQRRAEEIAKAKEIAEQTERELMIRYQKTREEALRRKQREQAGANQVTLQVSNESVQKAIERGEKQAKQKQETRKQAPREKQDDKVLLFLFSHKKLFTILLIVSFVLLITCLIGEEICNDNMADAVYHYKIVFEKQHTAGCGMYTCEYCGGREAPLHEFRTSYGSASDFRYYKEAYDTSVTLEGFELIFITTTVFLLVACFINMAFYYKTKTKGLNK